MTLGNYDPDRPDVLGMEWPALYARDVPLDAGIEYGQTFRSTVAESLAYAYTYFSTVPSSSFAFMPLVTIYEKGKELATGPVNRTLVPCNGGTLAGTASLVGGATVAACLASPADTSYVALNFNGAGSAKLEFATAGLFSGKRILRLILHYMLQSGYDDNENPELGANLKLVPSGSDLDRAVYGFIQGDPSSGAVVRTVDVGEVCGSPPDRTLGPSDTNDRVVWTTADVQALDTTALRWWFDTDNTGSQWQKLFYCALEVVWCEENRVAAGTVAYSALMATLPAPVVGYNGLVLRTPTGASSWPKPASGEFVATVRLADNGGPYLTGGLTANQVGSFGPPPTTRLLDSFEVFAPHEGRAIPVGVDNEPKSADPVSALPPVALQTAGFVTSPDTHPYEAQLAAPVYAGVSASQELQQQAGSAARPYPWVRFWARRYGNPRSLTVTCDGQSVTITAAELDALPEIIDGWRYVALRFAVAPTMGTSGLRTVTFTSSAPIADRWEILGAIYTGGASTTGPTYGGTLAAATHDGARDTTADLAVSLATAAPVPTGLTATPRSYPVVGFGLDCGVAPSCIPTDIGYVDLLWAGVSVTGTGVTGTPITGFGYYEVQRKDTDPATSEYATIAHVTNQLTPRFADFEARRGIVSTYQVRVVRNDGTEGDWSAPTSGTPPAPTGGAAGSLVFTSNVDPTRSVAYGEAFTGPPVEDFGFPEAETRQLQRLYQRDYQTAFRPTERGGTAFSRALLIGSTAHPAAPVASVYGSGVYGSSVYGSGASPSADSGFDRLRDLAWAPDLPYVCVLDDLGNRWLANVNVPSGSVRRSSGLYVAQVVITEVTAVPSAGDRVAV